MMFDEWFEQEFGKDPHPTKTVHELEDSTVYCKNGYDIAVRRCEEKLLWLARRAAAKKVVALYEERKNKNAESGS